MRLINVVVISAFLLFAYNSNGQNNRKSKLDLMQGNWENIMNNDSEKSFTIIRGHKSLNFVYDNSNDLDFPINETIEGFQNFSSDYDSINIDSLKKDGVFYIVVDKSNIKANGWVYKPDYLTPKYFECDGELMSINGGQLVEYSKINELPFEALSKIYKRGRLDGKNYIEDYLRVRVQSIKPVKCTVYSEPNEPTKVRLNRDDVVIVIEETGKWLKIKYGESDIGWIKKEETLSD